MHCCVIWFSPQRRVGLLGTGTEWEGDKRVKGSTAETARKRPERPWTAARTMEVLRRCPLAIAQRLVHRAIAVSTAEERRVALYESTTHKRYCIPPPPHPPFVYGSVAFTIKSVSVSLSLSLLYLLISSLARTNC